MSRLLLARVGRAWRGRLAALAFLLGLGWLLRDNLRLRGELAQLQTAQRAQQQRTRELEAQLAQLRSSSHPVATPAREKPTSSGGTLAITLSVLSLRSAGGETFRLAPEMRTLHCKLLLDTPDSSHRYQVVLTQNGRELRSWRGLQPVRNAVTVELSTAQLSSGEYAFELRRSNVDGTFEQAGRYVFRLSKTEPR